MRLDYSLVHPNWTQNLPALGRSQKGEDVSLKWTFDNIGTTNKYYVEFGAIDGYEDCNSLYFRENQEWKGLSFYRSGEHEKALEAWKGDDSSRSLFNQGNSFAKLGYYKKAIDYYDKVLQGEPDHSDAKFNRELIKKILEDQEKQNQPSSNQESSGENQEKKNQDESNKPSSESDPSKKNQRSNESQQNLNQQDWNDAEMEGDSETEESSSFKDSESLQEKKDEEENPNQTSLAEEKKEELNKKSEKSSYIKPRSSPELTEENSQQQELRQWLKKVPDDPARLLRNKMFRAYQRNLKNLNTEIESW